MSWNPSTWSITSRKKTVVGITSRSHEINFQWLKEFIMRKYSDFLEVRHLPITNSNRRDWEEAVRTCSVVILYHTKHQGRVNVTDVDGSLYDAELRYLNHCLGRENVLVVLDDMDDISEKERQRILKAQPSLERLSSRLILIPERNKVEAANRKLEEFILDLSEAPLVLHTQTPLRDLRCGMPLEDCDLSPAGRSSWRPTAVQQTSIQLLEVTPHSRSLSRQMPAPGLHGRLPGVRRSPTEEERPEHQPTFYPMTSEQPRSIKNRFKDLGKYFITNSPSSSSSAPSRPKPPPHPTYRVGIFSRSAESNYTWLVDSLKADGRLRSADIKAFYISNQYSTFRSGLQQCHFAILYHTRKQGRINITDVTDSLYDNELQDMSEFLGKQSVIVVVDDLESSGCEVKNRILESQFSIRKCARDLFLFTETEKQTKNLEEIRGIIQKRLPNITAQRSIPDTAHPTAPHSDGGSFTRVPGSSVYSPKNRTSQDQEATLDISPSCSEAVSCQTTKRDNAEPESKRPKTLSSNENTNDMGIKRDLSELPSSDFLHTSHMNWDKLQQENEDLRRMIEELKQENLSQEETIKDQKNIIMTLTTERDTKKIYGEKERRTQNIGESQKKGEAKVQGEEIGMKTSFQEREERPHEHRTQPRKQERLSKKGHHMKEHLQNTAGSGSPENLTKEELITRLQGIINEKDLEIQRQREEIQKKGEEIQKKGEEAQRLGDKIQRQEEEIQWQGEEIQRQKEEIQRQGEEIQRQKEEIQRQGEEIQRLGDKIQRQGEEIQRQGEEIQEKGEVIQRQGEEIQRQRDEVQRQGEEIQEKGEVIQRKGEEIQRQGEEIQRQGEEIQEKGEVIQRQGKEICNYEFI